MGLFFCIFAQMYKIALFLIISLLISCSPQKRLNRLLKKHPELVQTDTIWKPDTIITVEVKADTIIKMEDVVKGDTIYITKENLIVKTFYNYHDSTIYVSAKCKSDTIIREIPVQVQTISAKPTTDWNFYLLIILSILVFIALFRKK
jgi:hypothetical protein